MQPASSTVTRRSLEFGIYRDGDNNLDRSQAVTLAQAVAVSKADPSIDFTIEDSTSRESGALQTLRYGISDGTVHEAHVGAAEDMASPQNLAAFVAHTLDEAQRNGAKQTWIELSDHGAGDGGGLEADSAHQIMSIDGMAAAIAQGVQMHAQAHPEDAGRTVDGVLANQCLMASLGFADELSHAGVRYLAASPETMLSPGTPTNVAQTIAQHIDDPKAMAQAVVHEVMDFQYHAGGESWGPAAAFDVLDLAPQKWEAVESRVKSLNDLIGASAPATAATLRADARAIDGMVRFPDATPDMPWHADRPALALYEKISADARVPSDVRAAAAAAENAVRSTVLAHAESAAFAPFGGSDYTDAAGPTVHFPVSASQVDPWGPGISETNNVFYKAVDGKAVARAIA